MHTRGSLSPRGPAGSIADASGSSTLLLLRGHPWFRAACRPSASRQAPTTTAGAESYFIQSRQLAATLEMRPLVAHCHFELASLGKADLAREHLAAATATYRGTDMPF